MKKFIEKLTYPKIAELILKSESKVVFSSINIHSEIAIPLTEVSQKGISVKVIIDADEENFRNGYGDIKNIDLLKSAGIEIFEVKGNSISFLIVDDIGYFFFPQSLIFKSDATGPNAILMDSMTQIRILAHYFPPKSALEKYELLNKAQNLMYETNEEIDSIIDGIKKDKTDIQLSFIDENKFLETKEKLKLNPVLQPDLKRRINVYTAKIQFVELNFVGSNFHTTKVNIPNSALPIHDAELKKSLETKLNIFNDIKDNQDFKKLNQIKQMVESLRTRHKPAGHSDAILKPIKCRNKSVIQVSEKKKLLSKLDEIKKEIDNYKKCTLEGLEKEILRRKKTIKKELRDFFIANPPKEYQNFSESLQIDKIDDLVQQIISKIKFPDVNKLISDLKLKYNFYDLTFEDFRDDELIKEFREKKILESEELDDIISIRAAFEAAK